MSEKAYLYDWKEEDLEDLTGVEVKSFKMANEINDRILDIKTMVDELNYEWDEYMKFLDEKHISKILEFKGEKTIDFNDELLHAIANTLKKSLVDTQKDLNINAKKISLNRVADG